MVTFFTPTDAILWCIAVQKQLLTIDWPDDLLQQPAGAKGYAKDDAVRPIDSTIT